MLASNYRIPCVVTTLVLPLPQLLVVFSWKSYSQGPYLGKKIWYPSDECASNDDLPMQKVFEVSGDVWLVQKSHQSQSQGSVRILRQQAIPCSILPAVTNFIQSYLYQFFDDSHGLKASLNPLRRPFNWYQSRLKAINNGWDIKQINW